MFILVANHCEWWTKVVLSEVIHCQLSKTFKIFNRFKGIFLKFLYGTLVTVVLSEVGLTTTPS